MPIHLVVVYLAPGAYVGTVKYASNSHIMAAAAALVEALKGPVILAGDWNAPANIFEALNQLEEHGGPEGCSRGEHE